jgi:hypothetical protein
MRCRINVVAAAVAVCGLSMAWSSRIEAQIIPPGGGGQGNNNLNVSAGPAGGVEVDAEGVLRTKVMPDKSGDLIRQAIRAGKAQLDAKLTTPSKLRKVSLTRLERAIKECLDKGQQPPAEMLNLAGLTRVQYVFFYPDTKDIVLAGPAEGFVADPTGRMIGMESGRAVLQLEDLVVALRAFGPGTKGASVIGCSIDPTKEGLAAMQKTVHEYARRMRTAPNAQQVGQLVSALRESLGFQTVTVSGVSPKTHVAKVLVEADYRMKLIGIGLEKPAVKMTTYIAAANPAAVSQNALRRWYFVPNYECVRVSEDKLAMELVGDGVKLVGEDELVSRDGTRQNAGSGDRAGQLFATSFTKVYPELAKKSPVYAELRNVIDMAVAAAFIQAEGLYAKAGWNMEVLGSEKQFPTETHNAPKRVPSACTAVWKNSRLMTPIGGGVRVEPRQAISASNLLKDEAGKLDKTQKSIDLSHLTPGQWWWD